MKQCIMLSLSSSHLNGPSILCQPIVHSGTENCPGVGKPRVKLLGIFHCSQRRSVVSNFSFWGIFGEREPQPSQQSVLDEWADTPNFLGDSTRKEAGVEDIDSHKTILRNYWNQLQGIAAAGGSYQASHQPTAIASREAEAASGSDPCSTSPRKQRQRLRNQSETRATQKQHFQGALVMATQQINIGHSMLVSRLRQHGILKSERAIRAMGDIDRGLFVPPTGEPYEDAPQYIGYNATISAPHMHAECLQLLSQHLQVRNRAHVSIQIFYQLSTRFCP